MTTAAPAMVSPARLTFRMATPEDSHQIVGLLNGSFRTVMDEATWNWYVYRNPLGNSQIYLAIASDNTVAGVIGFAPMPLVIQGRMAVAGYAHHLVLKPEFRDTLSYLAILRYSLKCQEDRATRMVFGPPNKRAYPIHKTLMKWFDYGYLDRLRKLSPASRSHNCTELTEFPANFNEFYQKAAASLEFHVDKNTEWMNWRFTERPGRPYTMFATWSGSSMTGYVVLKRWQDQDGYRKAHIVDMHALDNDVLENLIAAAESWADGHSCQEVNLWSVQGYVYRSSLETMDFTCDHRQPLLARTFDGARLPFPEGPGSLSYGDGDTLY